MQLACVTSFSEDFISLGFYTDTVTHDAPTAIMKKKMMKEKKRNERMSLFFASAFILLN